MPGMVEDLPQQARDLSVDHDLTSCPAVSQVEVQAQLVSLDEVLSDLQQRGQLGLVMGGPDVLDDPRPARDLLSDLDRSRPRSRPHTPHKHATTLAVSVPRALTHPHHHAKKSPPNPETTKNTRSQVKRGLMP